MKMRREEVKSEDNELIKKLEQLAEDLRKNWRKYMGMFSVGT